MAISWDGFAVKFNIIRLGMALVSEKTRGFFKRKKINIEKTRKQQARKFRKLRM
jgi:hypothetical protein